jgi:ABC-type multidrug transport system, ATPase component
MRATLATLPAAGRLTTVRNADIMVRVDGLTKRFKVRRGWMAMLRHPRARESATALGGVSFEVRRGEFFGLLGENGAGKTTLFKVLASLVTPDGGTVTVDGFDVVRDSSRVRRLLAPVIADERSLNWRLSARENLRLFAALHDLRGAAKEHRVSELMELTGIADTGDKMVGQFSSGMKQRLLIARALLSRPSVLLLDEPTRSLDPLGARRFRQFLREEIVARQGCTVLIATHKAEEALELCDRVAILDRGTVRAVGTPDELSSRIVGERYQVWTLDPSHPALGRLAARGTIRTMVVGECDDDGWTRVQMEIPGGPRAASEVIAYLAGEQVTVSSFERVRLPLAELIERIVESRVEETANA